MEQLKKKKKVHYFATLSPLKQAWKSMWISPSYSKEEVLKLNEDFLDGFYKSRAIANKKRAIAE